MSALGLQGKTRLEAVGSVLACDPDAACRPFWDHHFELPLGYALRLGCDADVLKLLLDAKADPDCPHIHGQKPPASPQTLSEPWQISEGTLQGLSQGMMSFVMNAADIYDFPQLCNPQEGSSESIPLEGFVLCPPAVASLTPTKGVKVPKEAA